MVKKILHATDPKLRKESKPIQKVDKKVLNIARDLVDTLVKQTDPEGVGLAAPQVGIRTRMFAMEDKEGYKVVINPQILYISEIKKIKTKPSHDDVMEGCLSIPHYYGPVKRASRLKLKYLDVEGKEVIENFQKFPAQIVQHEVDHLDGILFVDKLLEQKKSLYKYVDDGWEKVELIF